MTTELVSLFENKEIESHERVLLIMNWKSSAKACENIYSGILFAPSRK